MDRNKLLKMAVILAAVVVIACSLSKFMRRDSMSLSEYARLNDIPREELPDITRAPSSHISGEDAPSADNGSDPSGSSESGSASEPNRLPGSSSSEPGADPSQNPESASSLIGASLNGSSQEEQRILLEDGFYYEPLSDNLRRYMTGISFPASDDGDGSSPEITFDDLRYVHILHYDFDGLPREGELICNEAIAQDLVEIFEELYRSEYRLEKVLLIDVYDGDDEASMTDNNTSCFNYRNVEGSSSLSNHALGLAVDINPLYNPYITYSKDGSTEVAPASAAAYADRSGSFPYKIDEDDLCYKLFLRHGFTWGGNWNNVKDYQHFQKAK